MWSAASEAQCNLFLPACGGPEAHGENYSLTVFVCVAGGPRRWPVGGSRALRMPERAPGRATEEDSSDRS